MNLNPPRTDWFFPIEEAPLLATVTHKGVARNLWVPHKKALVAADTGHIVGIVGAGYQVFTNQQAAALCQRFCLESFPDTAPAERTFVDGHVSGTRSWTVMDIHHRAHAMSLWGIPSGPSETRHAFRADHRQLQRQPRPAEVGFLREQSCNGVISEPEAATLTVPHTRQGIHSLKVTCPFARMASWWFLVRKFSYMTFRIDAWGRVSKSAYMPQKSLGERLAELRHEAGLSLRELGEKVGASAPHVRDVEIGNRQPSEALVEKLAAALRTDLNDLLKYSTRPPSRQMEELIEQDPQYSLAFRKFVDAVREKNIPPSEILNLSENLPNKKEEP